MRENEVTRLLDSLSSGGAATIDCAAIAAIPPALVDDDEYAYAEQLRERIRSLCAKFGVYSLELDQDGPVEDPIDFCKVTMPSPL